MKDGKHVILCVDDDPDVLSYLQTVLEAEGYSVVAASSAEEGMDLYRTVDPDLLIVDLMMEEVDAGTNFVKELRLLENESPVYMLSSVGDSLSMAVDHEQLGLAGVFQKPLSRETLLKVLESALAAAI